VVPDNRQPTKSGSDVKFGPFPAGNITVVINFNTKKDNNAVREFQFDWQV
jgi:hypothetical protein